MKPMLRELFYYLSLITYLGVIVSVAVFLGYYIGTRIDQWLHTGYIFTLIGSGVGSITGLYTMYKLAVARLDK